MPFRLIACSALALSYIAGTWWVFPSDETVWATKPLWSQEIGDWHLGLPKDSPLIFKLRKRIYYDGETIRVEAGVRNTGRFEKTLPQLHFNSHYSLMGRKDGPLDELYSQPSQEEYDRLKNRSNWCAVQPQEERTAKQVIALPVVAMDTWLGFYPRLPDNCAEELSVKPFVIPIPVAKCLFENLGLKGMSRYTALVYWKESTNSPFVPGGMQYALMTGLVRESFVNESGKIPVYPMDYQPGEQIRNRRCVFWASEDFALNGVYTSGANYFFVISKSGDREATDQFLVTVLSNKVFAVQRMQSNIPTDMLDKFSFRHELEGLVASIPTQADGTQPRESRGRMAKFWWDLGEELPDFAQLEWNNDYVALPFYWLEK